MLAQNAASTYDKIIRNMLVATAAQIDCLNGKRINAVVKSSLIDMEAHEGDMAQALMAA